MEANFMNACSVTSNGQVGYCRCVWEQVRRDYSVSEYIDLEARVVAGGPLPGELEVLADSCGSEWLSVQTTTSPRSSGALPGEPWSDERLDYVSEQLGEHFELAVVDVWLDTQTILEREFVCVALAATNIGIQDQTPSMNFFTLVRPTGTVAYQELFVGVDPRAPAYFQTAVPGGTSRGEVCFATDGERGDFLLRYEPFMGTPSSLVLSVDRLTRFGA